MKGVLNLNLKLIAFKIEKAERQAKSEDDSDKEPEVYLTYVSNLLRSLFSNYENHFINTMVYNKYKCFLSS